MESARTLLTLGDDEYGNAIGICIIHAVIGANDALTIHHGVTTGHRSNCVDADNGGTLITEPAEGWLAGEVTQPISSDRDTMICQYRRVDDASARCYGDKSVRPRLRKAVERPLSALGGPSAPTGTVHHGP